MSSEGLADTLRDVARLAGPRFESNMLTCDTPELIRHFIEIEYIPTALRREVPTRSQRRTISQALP
jgi:hypothetical protein